MIEKLRKLLKRGISFIKTRPVLSISAGVVLVTTITLVIASGGDNKYDLVTANEMNLVQEVSVTGQVRAVEDANLAFEQTGIISQVLADVGDEVKVGQTLVSLRNSDALALLNQAEAQVDFEQATLNNLMANTEQDLESSYDNALNTINDAMAKAGDAVRSKTAGLFSGSKNFGYNLSFDSCSEAKSNPAETLKLAAELELDRWNKEIKGLDVNSSYSDLDEALGLAQGHLNVVQNFVDAINAALQTKCATDNSLLDAGRVNMSTAQTNISAVIDNINDTMQTVAANKISADSANDIAAQEAKVRAAEASADNYRAQFQKTIIRSPINGIVTKLDASAGETVTVNAPIVSVISAASFEIETYIPEADISKVKVGNTADVTLDAYGDDVLFQASVITIDIGETMIEGVTTYKTILQFTEEDERVKPGMTANIDILTAERNNVIAIPQRAVSSRNGQKFVKLLGDQGEVEEVVVETGLRGSDGNLEITAGINAGDKIITFVREEN